MTSKSPDAFRTISEVADWLDVPTHVLRFWESRFSQVKPVKRAGGRRYYRPGDMRLLGGIKRLLHDDGLTIRGVQKLLREEGVRHVAALSPPLEAEAVDVQGDNVVHLADAAPDMDRMPDRWPFSEGAEEAVDSLADDLDGEEAAPAPADEPPAPESPQEAPTEEPPAAETPAAPVEVEEPQGTAPEAPPQDAEPFEEIAFPDLGALDVSSPILSRLVALGADGRRARALAFDPLLYRARALHRDMDGR